MPARDFSQSGSNRPIGALRLRAFWRTARSGLEFLCDRYNRSVFGLSRGVSKACGGRVERGDAPRARQHAQICAEEQLRAQSPMRRGAGPTGWWRGDVRSSATSATQPIQLPTHSDHSPPPTARIGPKLGRNIEHWWYDGSPVNRSTAIPRSPAISQDIYQWFQGSHSARGHSGLKQTTFSDRSSATKSTLQIRATPDIARCVTRPKSET